MSPSRSYDAHPRTRGQLRKFQLHLLLLREKYRYLFLVFLPSSETQWRLVEVIRSKPEQGNRWKRPRHFGSVRLLRVARQITTGSLRLYFTSRSRSSSNTSCDISTWSSIRTLKVNSSHLVIRHHITRKSILFIAKATIFDFHALQ